jgi:lipoprotein-anchoring transpeptidase ErfK/SrfK
MGCLLAAILSIQFAAPASARVNAVVDLSSQTVDVYVNGVHRHRWRTSTGRRGYRTPTGVYSPKRLERDWYSRKYYWSPMPYSVFFRGGYAIHGTTETGRLGRPASHGCIRLRTAHARELFNLIRRYGMNRSRIIIRN